MAMTMHGKRFKKIQRTSIPSTKKERDGKMFPSACGWESSCWVTSMMVTTLPSLRAGPPGDDDDDKNGGGGGGGGGGERQG